MPKQNVIVSLRYDDAWHNITEDVYTRDPIQITRGRGDEQSEPTPGSASLVVNNGESNVSPGVTGRYSPRNPNSDLFGKIGRNTPIKIALSRVFEDFEDATLSVSVTGTGDAPWARASDQAYAGTWSYKSGSITHEETSSVRVAVPAGAESLSFWYRISCEEAFDLFEVYDNEATLLLQDSGEIDWTYFEVDVTGLSYVQFSYIKDDSVDEGDDAVWIDNLAFSSVRFFGEVPAWPVRWETSGNDVWVEIEAAGILRRLGQGAKPLQSALRRAITRAEPLAYWPLEDPPGSLSAGSPIEGIAPMEPLGYSRFTIPGSGGAPQPAAGLPVFGSGTGIPSSNPVIDLSQGGVLEGVVPKATSPTGWRVEWIMAAPRDQADSRIVLWWETTDSFDDHPPAGGAGLTTMRWEVQIEAAGIFAWYGRANNTYGTASATFNVFDGLPHYYQVDASTSGGSIVALMYIDGVLAASYSSLSDTMDGTAGQVTSVIVNPLEYENGDSSMPVLGHVAVWSPVPTTDTHLAATGYTGETAAERVERLCTEEGVPVTIVIGSSDDSEPMGAQRPLTFLALLREAEVADLGILYERRDALGLVYRSRSTLYNQAGLVIDYASDLVAPPLEPVDDDQSTRNDVTVSRTFGAEARAIQEVGPLSIEAPPNGVGPYDESVEANLATDAQLVHAAGWRRHLGTWDEARYPRVRAILSNSEWAALLDDALALDVSDVITLRNLPAWLPPDDTDQLVQGYTEIIAPFQHEITWNTTPGGPYVVGEVEDDELGRADTDGSELASLVGTLNGSLSITVTEGPIWIRTATHAAMFPFDICVGGERMTVTAISGASSPQTFTVTRSVNGVSKSHSAGTAVSLWTPWRAAQ